MTPNDIEVLLHHYVSPRVHERIDAPAVVESIEQFIKDGLMVASSQGDSGYGVTDKGIFLVKMLCSTPVPVESFIDPRWPKADE